MPEREPTEFATDAGPEPARTVTDRPPESGPAASLRARFLLGWTLGTATFTAIVALTVVAGDWPFLDGQFFGPDAYMRLVRARECLGGPGCDAGLLERSNAPYGDVLHWPLLPDWVLLVLAAPFRPFVDTDRAIEVAGYLFSPVMGIAALGVAAWMGVRLLPGAGGVLVSPLYALQRWMWLGFAPARPDYHSMQTLLFLGLVAAFLCVDAVAEEGQDRARRGVLSGLALGLAAWVGIQSVAAALPVLLVPWVWWVMSGDLRTAHLNRRLYGTAALVLLLGLVVDGPLPERWAPVLDRFSIVHVALVGLAAAFWIVASRRTWRAWARALLLVGLAVCTAPLVLAFGLLGGAFAQMDPELWPLLFTQVAEYQPGRIDPLRTSKFHTWVPALVAALFALPMLRSLPRAARVRWAGVTLLLFWLGALYWFGQIRWGYFLHTIVPFGLAAGVGWAFDRETASRMAQAAVRVLLLLLVWASPFLLLVTPRIFGWDAKRPGAVERHTTCRLDPGIIQWLGAARPNGEAAGLTVLAPVFVGPNILYHTRHSVIATPYHRNDRGVLDSHRFMAAANDADARVIAVARDIDVVVACRRLDWEPRVPADAPGTLYARLMDGRAPDWMRPLPTPSAEILTWTVSVSGEASR